MRQFGAFLLLAFCLRADDVARGRQLFLGHCAPCHGPAGDGGRGASLTRPRLNRAATEKELFQVIKDGVEGTEMPGAWAMIDREIWQVVAYVRTLGRVGKQALPGDRARGEQLYRSKGGCAACHAIHGDGGRTGPDLSDVGARRSPAYLRASLTDPGADVPENFFTVRVVTRDGRTVTGMRLNEDTYSIQLRDTSDRLYSFWKSELAEVKKERGQSLMPAYGQLFTSAELDDLVAYLAGLRQ